METAEQNTKQVMEENDVLKQLIELFNQQDMGGQSQDFMGIFWYVAGMQVQLSAMVDELQGVREQLSQMQENQPKSVTEKLMYEESRYHSSLWSRSRASFAAAKSLNRSLLPAL